MISDIFRQRISALGPGNAVEQENMLQELMQHLVLASLSRAGFFSVGCFHGGTCLRILYGTSRFSEDLCFLLKKPDPGFRWNPFLERIRRDCLADGIHFDVQDKTRADTVVQKAFLKTDSIGQILTLDLPFQRDRGKKIRVKLEVDANPPAGSRFESRYITFPMTAAITTQDLGSGFATKSHALLCRGYTKGRDWYDFLWYVSAAQTVGGHRRPGPGCFQRGAPSTGGRRGIQPASGVVGPRKRSLSLRWDESPPRSFLFEKVESACGAPACFMAGVGAGRATRTSPGGAGGSS